MKKGTSAALAVFLAAALAFLPSCSDSSDNSDNGIIDGIPHNRSNGSIVNGKLSYMDGYVYADRDNGISRFRGLDDEHIGSYCKEERLLEYPQLAPEDCDLSRDGNYFSLLADGFIVATNKNADFSKVTLDKTENKYFAECKLYITDFKGAVTDTLILRAECDKQGNIADNKVISSFKGGFLYDNGYVYGQNSEGDTLRCNIKTMEQETVCEGFICLAGDYIYFQKDNSAVSRIKEADLSGEETYSFNLEDMEICAVASDGTVTAYRENVYVNINSVYAPPHLGTAWYGFKFGEAPTQIEDFLKLPKYLVSAGGIYFYENTSSKSAVYCKSPYKDGNFMGGAVDAVTLKYSAVVCEKAYFCDFGEKGIQVCVFEENEEVLEQMKAVGGD